MGLDATKLRSFSDACAKRRNDLSHFGGQRDDGDSEKFITEVVELSDALASLYQMMLLHEIGIDEKILKSWIFEGFGSHTIKSYLARVGLIAAIRRA